SVRIASIAAGAPWRSIGRPAARRAMRNGLSRSRKHFARSERATGLRPEQRKPDLAFHFVLMAADPAARMVRYHWWTSGVPTSKRRTPSWQCKSQTRPPEREPGWLHVAFWTAHPD